MSLNILHSLRRVGQAADIAFEREASKAGITARQAVVINHIRDNPGDTQHSLTTATSIDRSTLSDIVRRLETNGITKRVKDKSDSRKWQVSLTAKGAKLADSIDQIAASVTKEVLATAKSLGVTVKAGA